MTALTGRQTKLGIDIAGTFGTPDAATKLIAVENFNQGDNNTTLSRSPIGIGKSMATNIDIGATDPQVSFSTKVGFQNNIEYIFAQFYQTASTPAEQNSGEGDYLTRLTLADTLNAKWLTMAELTSSTTTMEWPSVALNSYTLTYEPQTYLSVDFAGMSNIRNLSSATNTTSVLNALSAPSENEIVVEMSDSFWINAQGGGSLSSGDKVNITKAVFTYEKPQERVAEIKGSAGNSETRSSGLYRAYLTVEFRNLTDHAYYTAAAAGTEYKAQIVLEGDQIGSGDNYTFAHFWPRLKIVEDPTYNLADPGENPLSVTFECLEAATNPTGMNSVRPYIEYTNGISTSYLA